LLLKCTAALDTGNKVYESESELENDAVKLARKRGWFSRKYRAAGRRSQPDRIFIRSGRVFWVEFKRLGNEPTTAQWEEIKAMLGAGADVIWLDSIEDFRACLIARERP
jgi:hypothetical protein